MSLTIPHIPQELFQTTQVQVSQVGETLSQLGQFAKSFAPYFYRKEQGKLSKMYLEGLVSDLHRKSIEPIAIAHHHPRTGLQRFVGQGKWEDTAVRTELHRQVAQVLGDPEGILVLDSSGFPKKGSHSVGVARQWCGRLGKEDNCQVGVFLGYVGHGSYTLVDGDLYLPHEWTRSRARLDSCHVPRTIGFRTKIQIAQDLLGLAGPKLPHQWIVGDDEFGRPADFRRKLRKQGERYVLDVPSNTQVRDLAAPPPERRPGQRGPSPQVPFLSVKEWAQALPPVAWKKVLIRHGEKGVLEVEIAVGPVRTRPHRKVGPQELLVVTRTIEAKPEYKYLLSNAESTTPHEILARVAATRHWIEQCFEISKDDIGMDHYEVRSWLGWQHHMTMSFLAHWFLTLEHRRLGEKISSPDSGLDGNPRKETAA
jgi:SRSO17 transposase